MNLKPSTSKKLRALEPCEIYELFQMLLLRETAGDQHLEQIWTIALDKEGRMLGLDRVHLGSLSCLSTDVRDIFRIPLQKDASAVMLVHINLGSNVVPDDESIQFTEKLIQTGRLLNLPVLDHLLLSDKSYYSFAHSQLLHEMENSTRHLLLHSSLKERNERINSEQAKAIGENNRNREIARNMKKSGASPEYIMQITGLSRASIAHLKTDKEAPAAEN